MSKKTTMTWLCISLMGVSSGLARADIGGGPAGATAGTTGAGAKAVTTDATGGAASGTVPATPAKASGSATQGTSAAPTGSTAAKQSSDAPVTAAQTAAAGNAQSGPSAPAGPGQATTQGAGSASAGPTAAGQSSGATAKATRAAGSANAQDVSAAMRDLLDTLVQQGALTRERADAVLRKMEQRLLGPGEAKRPPPPANPNVVGVPYVPQFVKDDIREQLRKEMGKDVMNDILAKAKKERWGIPGALPKWVNRTRLYGDIRVRAQGDFFARGNAQNYYPNFQAINQAGGVSLATYPFLNTTINQYRLRLRGRLGLDATISQRIKLGLQITTGNTLNPVTFNQDLGTYGRPFQVVWNKFFLRYQSERADGSPSLTVWGGRFRNPWLSTDLVWYHELNFQGVAGTKRLYFHAPAVSKEDPSRGHDYLFMTLAAVPLQDIQFTTNDKWLYGAQVGTDWLMQRHTAFEIGVAYYHFANISGKMNAINSNLLNYTAPPFVQKGNTMYDINNDNNPSTDLYALAADYHLVDITAKLDLAQLAPTHVIFMADYVKNIGYSEDQVFQRTNQNGNGQHVAPRNVGYQFGITVGWPQDRIAEPGHWQIFGAYKHLERDAVVDAFTDSNFHLGGTDAKGFIIRGEYGLATNTWLAVHWYSSNAIDGPAFGIDTLQVGILAKF